METSRHWLLWDGDCGVCRAAAGWVARHDRTGRFTVVAWQRAPSPPMTAELARACQRAVQVLPREGLRLGGDAAVLFILGELGWPRLARLGRCVPFRWLIAGGYRLVARHRGWVSRVLGLSRGCSVDRPM